MSHINWRTQHRPHEQPGLLGEGFVCQSCTVRSCTTLAHHAAYACDTLALAFLILGALLASQQTVIVGMWGGLHCFRSL